MRIPKFKLSVVPIGALLQAVLRAHGHRRLGAFVGIEVHMRRIAIDRQRHKFLGKISRSSPPGTLSA